MNNSAPPDTSSERGDPTLYFRIRAACQDVVHHLIRTVEERHGESTPSSAAAVTFDRGHATRPCLRVPAEEIEIVHVKDSTPQVSNHLPLALPTVATIFLTKFQRHQWKPPTNKATIVMESSHF